MSEILSKPALRTLSRLGDIMLPKTDEFPSFSETGCLDHIDDIIAYAPKEDISSLNILLIILAFCPQIVLKKLVKNMEQSHLSNSNLSLLFRQLDFGLKGIIYTCYYSGKTASTFTGKNPHEIIGFQFNQVVD